MNTFMGLKINKTFMALFSMKQSPLSVWHPSTVPRTWKTKCSRGSNKFMSNTYTCIPFNHSGSFLMWTTDNLIINLRHRLSSKAHVISFPLTFHNNTFSKRIKRRISMNLHIALRLFWYQSIAPPVCTHGHFTAPGGMSYIFLQLFT